MSNNPSPSELAEWHEEKAHNARIQEGLFPDEPSWEKHWGEWAEKHEQTARTLRELEPRANAICDDCWRELTELDPDSERPKCVSCQLGQDNERLRRERDRHSERANRLMHFIPKTHYPCGDCGGYRSRDLCIGCLRRDRDALQRERDDAQLELKKLRPLHDEIQHQQPGWVARCEKMVNGRTSNEYPGPDEQEKGGA